MCLTGPLLQVWSPHLLGPSFHFTDCPIPSVDQPLPFHVIDQPNPRRVSWEDAILTPTPRL